MAISDSEIEAGAEAAYNQRIEEVRKEVAAGSLMQMPPHVSWEQLGPSGKEHERAITKACLEAAERVRGRLH